MLGLGFARIGNGLFWYLFSHFHHRNYSGTSIQYATQHTRYRERLPGSFRGAGENLR